MTANTSFLGSPSIFLPRRQIVEGFSEKTTFFPPWYLYAYRLSLSLSLSFFLSLLSFLLSAVCVCGVYVCVCLDAQAGASYSFISLFLVMLCKKLVLHGLQPGVYPLHSTFALRKWVSDRLMAMSLTTNYTLYSTLYTVPCLRLLGAKIGAWSEVSTVQHIEPDLLSLGAGVFIADMASIGAACFHRGHLALRPCVVGDRTFVGNSAIVPCNTVMYVESVSSFPFFCIAISS